MKVKQLKNGMKVVIDPTPTKSKLVEIGFYVRGGMYTENKKTLGYNHFLEHLVAMFPSKKYPHARQNLEELEKRSIFHQGITTEYHTQIFLRGAHTHDNKIHNLMLDMITSVITDFTLDENVFKQEKASIQSELSEYMNDPFLKLNDLVNKTFAPGHISSTDMSTELKHAAKVEPENIQEFYKHFIIPENMVFYMVGNTPSYSVFKKYKDRLENISNKKPAFSISKLKMYTLPSETPKTGIYNVKQPSITTRLHFRWRVPVTNFEYKKISIVDCVSHLLQYIIIEELRHKQGLIYGADVQGYFDPINRNLSYLSISTDAITRVKANKITLGIVKIITELQSYIDDGSLDQYKKHSVKKYEIGKQDCNIQANVQFYIPNLIADEKLITRKELLDVDKSLKPEEVTKFIKKYIIPDKLYFLYSGPDSIFR